MIEARPALIPTPQQDQAFQIAQREILTTGTTHSLGTSLHEIHRLRDIPVHQRNGAQRLRLDHLQASLGEVVGDGRVSTLIALYGVTEDLRNRQQSVQRIPK